MTTMTLTFELSPRAVARWKQGLTGDDYDVLLAMEKALAILLDVQSEDVQGLDESIDANVNVLLMEEGYPPSEEGLSQLADGKWVALNALRVEEELYGLRLNG